MLNNQFIHDTGLNEENSLTHLLDTISPDVENMRRYLLNIRNILMTLSSEPFYKIKIVNYLY